MKNRIISTILPGLLLATLLPLHADQQKEIVIKHKEPGSPEAAGEKEPVTYLGVETTPVSRTLAAQLGMPEDTGLVVTRVMNGSPATTVLQQHDILTKFDNQILIDMHQLRVLVRGKKEGDEVLLSYYRAGKENSAKVKLGKRDVPKMAGMEDFGPEGLPDVRFFNEEVPGPGLPGLRNLPGMDPEAIHDVLRMIGRERGNWLAAPQVHFFKHPDGQGSTILNLADGNFVFSDESGSVEVTASKNQRELTVKNPKGDVLFKGPINNEEDRRKLPPEVLARLDKIEQADVSFEAGDDFQQDTVVQPPQKTKIALPDVAHERPLSGRSF
jgi:serine protease Do